MASMTSPPPGHNKDGYLGAQRRQDQRREAVFVVRRVATPQDFLLLSPCPSVSMSVYLSIRRNVRYRPSVRHNYYYAEHLSLLGDAYGDVTLLYTYGEAIFSRVPDDVITESNAADVKHQNLK